MTILSDYRTPAIDFSTFPDSDGLPMADNERNQDQMIDLILQGKQAFDPLGHHVGGNLLVYYDPADGWKHLAPDVFVALDRGPERRNSWKTWVEGKFPEVIIEVASPSTRQRDIGAKVALYTQLGAREYYIFDPAGALHPAFRGYRIGGSRAEALANPTGRSIASPLLDVELRVVEGWLRWIDPATGAPYALLADERARADAEHARADAEHARADAERARADAEAKARQEAEADLQRLRAELARRREATPPQ